MALLDDTTELELFTVAAVGYDHPPLNALADHGVAVTNVSGIHTPNRCSNTGYNWPTSSQGTWGD
ncbi:hypothetical protein [Natrialba aegyptia]|uniref:D-isomer specific 2-hydroxyacid dehydrogenase NAD-binding protein n=1 Tax=Natrialba aegyptia DSM 13077 TaxID=1227491 RepID=M0ALW4_9EURY|nr:hypothetical protein [Natrialba aegyptia]ELY98378.1 D-isomer specific 2-hydroxyacid dehydrogenase NAD-binding protein [Natrialba aegyptia DSM 13077]